MDSKSTNHIRPCYCVLDQPQNSIGSSLACATLLQEVGWNPREEYEVTPRAEIGAARRTHTPFLLFSVSFKSRNKSEWIAWSFALTTGVCSVAGGGNWTWSLFILFIYLVSRNGSIEISPKHKRKTWNSVWTCWSRKNLLWPQWRVQPHQHNHVLWVVCVIVPLN